MGQGVRINCVVFRILFRILPFVRVRAILVERHLERCETCGAAPEFERELQRGVEALFSWTEGEDSLWPNIRDKALEGSRVLSRERERPLRFAWRWVMAGAALLCVLLFNTVMQEDRAPANASRVRINFARIRGEEIKPYIYQTDSTSFVFFKKPEDGG